MDGGDGLLARLLLFHSLPLPVFRLYHFRGLALFARVLAFLLDTVLGAGAVVLPLLWRGDRLWLWIWHVRCTRLCIPRWCSALLGIPRWLRCHGGSCGGLACACNYGGLLLFDDLLHLLRIRFVEDAVHLVFPYKRNHDQLPVGTDNRLLDGYCAEEHLQECRVLMCINAGSPGICELEERVAEELARECLLSLCVARPVLCNRALALVGVEVLDHHAVDAPEHQRMALLMQLVRGRVTP